MDNAIRIVAAALCIYSTCRGVPRLVQLWPHIPAERRLLWVALLLFAASNAHALLESLARHLPIGPRTFSVLLASMVCAVAVSLPKTYRSEDR